MAVTTEIFTCVHVQCSIASATPFNIFKLVIVSREISGLHGVAEVKLDPDHDKRVTGDIERFISVRVEELSRIEGLNEEFRTTVLTTLLERARGTFLWVGFVVNELSQKKTCTEVLETLRTLPRGLPAIYSRMLLQIESSRRRISSLILRWVTMAVRPLTLQELAAVIGIQSSAFITTEQAVRDQIAFCGPLLKVREHEVTLVHQSARDYLLREEPARNPVLEEFRIKPEEVHLQLARTCFDCIEHSALQHAPLDITDASYLPESPLLLYAALHWQEHAMCCSRYAKELLDLSRPFLQKESVLRSNWWEAYRKRDAWLKVSSLPLLHMASYLGIASLVRMLLTKKTWKCSLHKLADKKDILGRTPLIYAARSGHEAVVRLLLEHGADVEAKDKERGETALILAAGSGYEAIVRRLLERRADVEAKEKERGTALILSAMLGHEAVVWLLLEHGADVEAKDKERGGTALILAAGLGHEAVVRLLLERGADIEAKDKERGETALIYAVRLGHEAIVRLLLERGAEVEAKEKEGGTALILSAMLGHEAVVRLLLERGVDIEAKDKERGGTALIWAAGLGHEAVVRLLLEHGANIEAKDEEKGETALIYAAGLRHEAVVRLLLEHGADVEAKDKERGGTALIWAAGSGHEAVVRLLLERGASVEAKEKKIGGTALMFAAGLGHVAVVRLLLECGADVEAKVKGRGATALILAAASGHEAVARLLKSAGAS